MEVNESSSLLAFGSFDFHQNALELLWCTVLLTTVCQQNSSFPDTVNFLGYVMLQLHDEITCSVFFL